MVDNNVFENTFERKLIYIFRIPYDTHKGLLKIGDTTIKSDLPDEKLFPNCKELNDAAKKRINPYTQTAGIKYDLLHTELAVRKEKNDERQFEIKYFRDKNVHKVLENSGIHKQQVNDTTGIEWFPVDLETAKNAIKACKENKEYLTNAEITHDKSPVDFRPEQRDAIKRTLTNFEFNNHMLWNAKMRFGKTLSALEVVKRSKFQKTIIATHRPVVNAGWREDFDKIFYDTDEYIYVAKDSNINISKLVKESKKFIYFASIQDLRGSKKVGGKFDKNNDIFEIDWDCVIIDEAHEGTTTQLGLDVKENLQKPNSKVLELSGTPFNILDKYTSEEVYTWDYIMEQKAKSEWDKKNFGDSNPYEELPKINILTYDLGETLGNKDYCELDDKAFNFKEFFRTWTGNIKNDGKKLPTGTEIGDFVHEKDVNHFLNLISTNDENSNYPYSRAEYQELFKHSLWVIPGVKEAKALHKLMLKHPVFGSGQFDIINVAGDGDNFGSDDFDDKKNEEALKKVKSAIKKGLKNDTYTITLSCGRLTTGVTVKEWTAVMMLAGSFSTSASRYMQTIFRVQSPANINGRMKENCYVFDFAPDRTLKMIADAVKLSTKAGKTSDSDRTKLGEFLNFCPVISLTGAQMSPYDENQLLQQLKRAYVDRAVKSGFEDMNLYNENLYKLSEVEVEKFDSLKKIIGSTKSATKTQDISINEQGFTKEEYEKTKRLEKKTKQERTPEEEAFLAEMKAKKEQRLKAISILRAISIRIPLLVYGAELNKDVIEIEDLLNPDIVDDDSWTEFMPTGVDREQFKDFIKYYDKDIFSAASEKIRNMVKYADTLAPTERVIEISKLFSYFKNPDKETVLTPWRVVNMHMGDCLGGYNFFDEKYENTIEPPRFIDQGEVTKDTLNNKDGQILEINSKTGLYPLYVTYSIFRSKCPDIDKTPIEEQRKIWNETVQNNIYVICKTQMAKSITKRTLIGFGDTKVNTRFFEDLVNKVQNKQNQLADSIKNPGTWKKKDRKEMKFDAVVGNPPYQLQGGSGGNNDAPIYQCFSQVGEKVQPAYLSLIMPARWFSAGRENLLGEFRRNMLANEHLNKMFVYSNPREVFPQVEIKGGICYYLINSKYSDDCEYTLIQEGSSETTKRKLNDFDVLIRDPKIANIVKKVVKQSENVTTVDNIISADTPFGISSNPKSSKKNQITVYETSGSKHNTLLYHIEKNERKIEYVCKQDINKHKEDIEKEKVFIPGASGSGADPYVLGKPEYAPKNSVCSQSYLYAKFNTEIEAKNFIKYVRTKFFRLLVSSIKISQSAPNRVYKFVPMQDYTNNSDIDWSKDITEIDKQLYKKYDLSEEEINYIESMIKSME